MSRRLMAPVVLGQACTTHSKALGSLEQAYTTQAGAGLLAIEMKSGKVAHQSPSFQQLTSWLPEAARGNIRLELEARDGEDFNSFCQSVVRDAGEPYGETFLDRDKVEGRCGAGGRSVARTPAAAGGSKGQSPLVAPTSHQLVFTRILSVNLTFFQI